MTCWIFAAAGVAATTIVIACVVLLVRLDGAVAEELRVTDEDRRWTSDL